jgi:molecular chaperone DnaK
VGGAGGYQLAIDLGTTYTAAALHRDGRVEVLALGNRAPTVPSVVLLREDESMLAGEAANRRGVSEPGRVAREFKRRVGDPTPLILGGCPYSAEALMAKLLRWTVARASELEGAPPQAIAVTHPANWGPYKLELLGQAVRLADLEGVTTLAEPEAAAIHYAVQERVEPGSVIAVYDLGGGTFDAAVLRKEDQGWQVIGEPEGIERLGGIDFDQAVMTHVQRALPEVFEALDPDDPVSLAAVSRLRHECTEAKEALSADTDVSIQVSFPRLQTEVRLTREEFEGMIRPPLQETIGALRRALRSAEVRPDELTAILLVGGSSRIPLVAQLVGAEFGRPVAVDAHPKHAIALGAALAIAPGEQPSAPTVPFPASEVADAPPGEHLAPAATLMTAAEGTEPSTAASDGATSPRRDGLETPVGPRGNDPEIQDPQPTTTPTLTDATASRSGVMRLVAAAVGVVVLAGLAGFSYLDRRDDDSGDDAGAASVQPEPGDLDEEADLVAGAATSAAEPDEPEEPDEPTPATRREPYAEISEIRVEGSRYVVVYEAVGFTPIIDDAGAFHVHLFWDTLPVINAGVDGPDPGRWLLWDTPFEVSDAFFDVTNRPQGARRICAVVADNGHAVADVTGDGVPDTDTGGCRDLPRR